MIAPNKGKLDWYGASFLRRLEKTSMGFFGDIDSERNGIPKIYRQN